MYIIHTYIVHKSLRLQYYYTESLLFTKAISLYAVYFLRKDNNNRKKFTKEFKSLDLSLK